LEQRHPQRFFQLDDLIAHGRLLDAVRHVTHRLADAAVPRHVIKQLQVMNVHAIGLTERRHSFIN
jgi:hypothetical protein